MTEFASSTPAMAQYLAHKRLHPDAMLFFRMGDFYELFFEDAKIASKVLGITLTSRSKGDAAIPMAGVPYRSLDGYLKRLVQKGHRVAICEQMQDPKEAKGVIERQVVRIVTPGTLTEDSLLDNSRPNHLVAITVQKDRAGLAWVELSTGAFSVHECTLASLPDELLRIEAAEVLLSDELRGQEREWLREKELPITYRAPYDFGVDSATRTLCTFFATTTLAGFGIDELPLATGAAGALIGYVQETQLTALPHVRAIAIFDDGLHMRLDRATQRSLELVQTLHKDSDGTPLLSILDRTKTPMGARLLRNWVLSPLVAVHLILQRQSAVAEFVATPATGEALQQCLQHVLDLERLCGRAAFGRAHARDLQALRQSLDPLPEVKHALVHCSSKTLRSLGERLDPLTDLADRIGKVLADDLPLGLRDGGLIRLGFDPALDELRTLAHDSNQWLARYQQQLVEITGIATLKVGFNKVFGYYIEITQAHKAVELPREFLRKQTTKNAERYVTDELRTFESKVLKAEENSKALEYELFCALREQVANEIERLQQTSAVIAELDAYLSLAQVARDRNYCKPELDDSMILRIEDGRHPVLEATHAAGTFVPNDTDLGAVRRRVSLLTGPNMAGKSTYIRQNALIVLLAQIGSFVPAKAARIGMVDRIFTRVGSSDDISRGASTFMVEMTETANILNNATKRSLVILDEVGRGTSTYDGMSLAWAIAEDLHDRVGCRALFATHYHQLTNLQAEGRAIVSQRVAVREWDDQIVFLHRIEDGGTDKSYGLHVARLAGIPRAVIARAEAVLKELESEGEEMRETLVSARERKKPGLKQKELFAPPPDPIVEALRTLDVDGLSPREALLLLAKWKEQAGG
jgi:DNA mismatch repair protein MutS